jgi:hypothetical protein
MLRDALRTAQIHFATWAHGSPLAVDPKWRELHIATPIVRRKHGRVNDTIDGKASIVLGALVAGAPKEIAERVRGVR